MMNADLAIRCATLEDIPSIETLITLSARALSAGDYSEAQIEGALRGAFGVDTQLIRDRTYFVVRSAGGLAACGGWSRRRTLFGSDDRSDRSPQLLDPQGDAAKIRAFFVHPTHARRGIGTALLEHCEREAAAQGFGRCELMATLPGVRLYGARGYVAGEPIEWPLPNGPTITFVPMSKTLRVHTR